jgi:hypothetical protein
VNVILIAKSAGGAASIATVTWALRHWRLQITGHLRELFGSAEALSRALSLLETFFNEAAVLWFVFPVLDSIYEIGKKGSGFRLIEMLGTAITSLLLAILFFYFAVLSKSLAHRFGESETQRGH